MANEDLKNTLATKAATGRAQNPVTEMRDLMTRMQGELARALPKHITVDRLMRVALTALRMNPELLKCTKPSLLAGVMLSAQLGLEIGLLGQCYLVPFKNHKKGVVEAQFIIGYQGYIELMYRTGRTSTVYAGAVRQNDEFRYSFGLNEDLYHRPAEGNRGEITHFYAYAKSTDGSYRFSVMTRADVDRVRDLYAKRTDRADSPWRTNYEAMGCKTVMRQLVKWVQKSVEIRDAGGATMSDVIAKDENILTFAEDSSAIIEISDGSMVDTDTGEVLEDAPKEEKKEEPVQAEPKPEAEPKPSPAPEEGTDSLSFDPVPAPSTRRFPTRKTL